MAILNTAGNASVRGFGFTSAAGGKVLISSTPGPAATVTTYSGYIVFKFTASATLNVGAGAPGTADVFVVGGGSTGGTPNNVDIPLQWGAYGGGGGSRTDSPGFTITANSPIPIVVGGTATASTFGPVTSSGGTGGGSGGGTAAFSPGNPGGNGPSNSYETGSPQAYGGGGGSGGTWQSGAAGTGGSSGGGPGGGGGGVPGQRFQPNTPGGNGTAGSANTGGGGGGGGGAGPGASVGNGGAGGSGVVIVRFPDTKFRTS